MKKIFLLSIILTALSICATSKLSAQGIAINATGSAPDSSAIIDVSSTTQGALIPRLTTAQRDALHNPASGLMIFNTDCNTINFNIGTPGAPNWTQVITTNNLAAAISIAINPQGEFCYGTSVTFTATPTNGGSSPSYQWKVNGGNVGADSSTYTTSSLSNGDVVTCVLTSNAPCVTTPSVTSNPLTMIVNYSPPAAPSAVSGPQLAGINSSGNTFSIPAVASATSYTWTVAGGGNVTSGQNTTSATISFGTEPSDTISVVANNNCGASVPAKYIVYIGSVTFLADSTGRYGTIKTLNIGVTHTYTIKANGAQGAYYCNSSYLGGQGASMQGDFLLTAGTVLNILVGQTAQTGGGGGGGGSFVVNAAGNTPLVIAGGGGGGGCNGAGGPGNTGTAGSDGTGGAQGTGGDNGGGGGGAAGYGGAGGGGFCGNGGNAGHDYCSGGTGGNGCANGTDAGCALCLDTKGLSYLNGAAGGSASCYPSIGDGGYGGGGASIHGNECGGGGGGYSGGGGGGYNGTHGYGGGGGSYNSGANQSNSSGVQSGDGMVVITF